MCKYCMHFHLFAEYNVYVLHMDSKAFAHVWILQSIIQCTNDKQNWVNGIWGFGHKT